VYVQLFSEGPYMCSKLITGDRRQALRSRDGERNDTKPRCTVDVHGLLKASAMSVPVSVAQNCVWCFDDIHQQQWQQQVNVPTVGSR
jgi:hypothetical protein